MFTNEIGLDNYSSNNKKKSETEKLKLALARSTIDNKRLEEEIQNLKQTSNFLLRPLADYYQNEVNVKNKCITNTDDSMDRKAGQPIETERNNELNSNLKNTDFSLENTFKSSNLKKNLLKYKTDFTKNEGIKHELKEITIKLDKSLNEITELKKNLDTIIERM